MSKSHFSHFGWIAFHPAHQEPIMWLKFNGRPLRNSGSSPDRLIGLKLQRNRMKNQDDTDLPRSKCFLTFKQVFDPTLFEFQKLHVKTSQQMRCWHCSCLPLCPVLQPMLSPGNCAKRCLSITYITLKECNELLGISLKYLLKLWRFMEYLPWLKTAADCWLMCELNLIPAIFSWSWCHKIVTKISNICQMGLLWWFWVWNDKCEMIAWDQLQLQLRILGR